jgi:hypothetical protein
VAVGPQVPGEIKSLARSPGGDGEELTPGRTQPHNNFTNKVVGDHAFGWARFTKNLSSAQPTNKGVFPTLTKILSHIPAQRTCRNLYWMLPGEAFDREPAGIFHGTAESLGARHGNFG